MKSINYQRTVAFEYGANLNSSGLNFEIDGLKCKVCPKAIKVRSNS